MALDTQVQLSYTYVDGLGIETSTVFYALVDGTQPISDLTAVWHDLWDAQFTLSSAASPRGKLTISMTPIGGGTAAAVSRVEQCAVFGFAAAGSDKRWSAVIPGSNSARSPGGRIDLGFSGVTDFLLLLTGGTTGAAFTNDHFQLLTTFDDAFLAYRKKRKQLQRSSFETA